MQSGTSFEPIANEAKRRVQIWSIGIFSGATLSSLAPVQEASAISARDITDVTALFVADPFMIQVNSLWYMFFEVFNVSSDKGEIGLAVSRDGIHWDYQSIVLSEPFHISYPYVFYAGQDYYMIPETYEAMEMRLYRAESFPLKWSYAGTLLEGMWVDSSPFFFQGQWWVFSNPVAPANQILELFCANAVSGPWRRHPLSPLIIGNNRTARGGGRIIMLEGKPVRFAQDCFPFYGTRVRAFEVTVLTHSKYEERELNFSPILCAGNQAWRREG